MSQVFGDTYILPIQDNQETQKRSISIEQYEYIGIINRFVLLQFNDKKLKCLKFL